MDTGILLSILILLFFFSKMVAKHYADNDNKERKWMRNVDYPVFSEAEIETIYEETRKFSDEYKKRNAIVMEMVKEEFPPDTKKKHKDASDTYKNAIQLSLQAQKQAEEHEEKYLMMIDRNNAVRFGYGKRSEKDSTLYYNFGFGYIAKAEKQYKEWLEG